MIASVCSLITNTVRQLYVKEGHKVEFTDPGDFMIKWGEVDQKPEPKKQTAEEMKEVMLGLVRATKIKDKRK